MLGVELADWYRRPVSSSDWSDLSKFSRSDATRAFKNNVNHRVPICAALYCEIMAEYFIPRVFYCGRTTVPIENEDKFVAQMNAHIFSAYVTGASPIVSKLETILFWCLIGSFVAPAERKDY